MRIDNIENQENNLQATVTGGSADLEKVSNVSALESRIVIVGAGLAGLAVAEKLYSKGFKNVLILEAQNRTGGRVETIKHSDSILELGAQWLHGGFGNPLYKWFALRNLVEMSENRSSSSDSLDKKSISWGGYFTSNRSAADKQVLNKVLEVIYDTKAALFKRSIQIESGTKRASDVFRNELNKLLSNDTQLSNNSKFVWAVFDWFMRQEAIENSCDSMDEVSTKSYTNYTDGGDGALTNLKSGYSSVVHWFESQIPAKDWIKLNSQVLNIELLKQQSVNDWLDNDKNMYTKPIKVTYCDSLNCNQSIVVDCDHVIVTVSIGVLKQNYQTMFKPSLTEERIKLIKAIGFGTVNKIFLQFESKFWNDDDIELLWLDPPKDDDLPEWASDIVGFNEVRNQPNCLMGWIGGHGARQLEAESDEQIGKVCVKILNKFLPKIEKQSKLMTSVASRWGLNEFVHGSYSFQSVDSFNLDVKQLYEPLMNDGKMRIQFAGEATGGKWYSTTHGAITSGWREAERLIDLLCNPCANKCTKLC